MSKYYINYKRITGKITNHYYNKYETYNDFIRALSYILKDDEYAIIIECGEVG